MGALQGPPTVYATSSVSEPQGKPKNTEVGSLSLLRWIFPTWGLLHCRRILYQLSYLCHGLFLVLVNWACPALFSGTLVGSEGIISLSQQFHLLLCVCACV